MTGGLRTEFDFTLPKGYVAADGVLHRQGAMRLATARDEIEPLRDRTIDGPDDPYLTILVLARVVTSLGSLEQIDHSVIEGLFAADLAFLQDLYGIINFGDQADVEALQSSVLAGTSSLQVEVDETADDTDDTGAEGDDIGDHHADAADDATQQPVRRRRAHIEEVVSTSTA